MSEKSIVTGWQKVKYILIAILAIYPILFLPYALYSFSSNLLLTPLLIVLISLLHHLRSKVSAFSSLRLILFAISTSVNMHADQSGLAFVFNILFAFCLLFVPYDTKILERYTTRITLSIAILSFVFYVVFVFGGSYLFPFDNGDRLYYLFGLTVSDFPAFSLLVPGSWRFYGFCNEPGAMAAVLMTIIFASPHRYLNIFANIMGFLTLSSGFLLIRPVYYVLDRLKGFKDIPKTLTKSVFNARNALLLLIISLLSAFLISSQDVQSFVSYKVLIDGNASTEERLEDRHDYSFFSYLNDSSPNGYFLFFTYLLSVSCAPRRYWLMLVLVGLYRHHFIYNFAPFLMPYFIFQFSLRSVPGGDPLRRCVLETGRS